MNIICGLLGHKNRKGNFYYKDNNGNCIIQQECERCDNISTTNTTTPHKFEKWSRNECRKTDGTHSLYKIQIDTCELCNFRTQKDTLLFSNESKDERYSGETLLYVEYCKAKSNMQKCLDCNGTFFITSVRHEFVNTGKYKKAESNSDKEEGCYPILKCKNCNEEHTGKPVAHEYGEIITVTSCEDNRICKKCNYANIVKDNHDFDKSYGNSRNPEYDVFIYDVTLTCKICGIIRKDLQVDHASY